ncbi:TonB-dependent receptor [Paraliomyxa miuraensis]|uniref:TonB-dependent receptor n=1 Tax=Paraliomyxa miuraensis TaxID=376150 RepID=UPI0022599911|nr:TonB-dependent receptor [Paraliomyxa miuraensis]MCX4241246.1 TonB-dependent receptor [Paraliomyxa miuraensis]
MNVRRCGTTQALVVLGVLGGSARAHAEELAPPEDDGFVVEDDSAAEPPPGDDGFAVEEEPIDEDGGEVIMPSTAPVDDGPVADVPEDDGDWSFEVEDISEDSGALEEEIKASTVEATKGPVGTVTGKVRDSVSGDPVIAATVEVVGGKYKTKTDQDGEFSLRLPPGVYELRLRSDSSQPLRISNVEVRQGGTVELNRDLKPLEGAGQVVEVEAEMNRESEGARLLQRKESLSARDLMSRDEIAKSGGGSTSSVARRIVGCTLVERRYLFCRGLGHRYGNTLFDGARVPSPEPELRTVPLDIFPSGALSAINIQKTFTPDVPGDFAGASVQLESREVPDDFILEVGAEIGANTATTGRQMVTSAGFAGADAFGFGNYPRGIPEVLPTNLPIGPTVLDPDTLSTAWTPEQTEAFGESLLSDTRVRSGAKAPPNFGFNATTGWGREYGKDGKIGFLASARYKAKHETLREQVRVFGLDGGELDLDTPRTDYGEGSIDTTYNVAWSGVGLVKWKANKNHRLELLGFYSRDTDDQTRLYQGDARNVAQGAALVTNTRLRYVMRSILLTRLGGKHTFPGAKGLQFDWFGSYAMARRDDPSMRDMVFTTNDAGLTALNITNGGGKQLFLDLTDDTESGAANFTLPFKQWGQLDSKFKTGVWVEGKQREFFARRFAVGQTSGSMVPPGTGDVLGPENIGGNAPMDPAPFFYRETTRALDNYDAEQEIYATYAMMDLPIVRWFKLAGGARFEASFIDVQPFDYFGQNDVSAEAASLDEYDVLPSASLIFSPNDEMNIRLVGARTLARPEFRELAPFEFEDFVGGTAIVGNRGLVSTDIWNADLRWEWFPSASEVVAVSLFYKYFDEPIEKIASARAGSRLASFRNATWAQNVGFELEARKNLEFLGKALENFSLGGNFAYVFSRVRLGEQCDPSDPTCDISVPDASTSRERPLQGQSPFVVNAFLDYTNKKSGTNGRLLYNAFGRRIDEVGALGLPDIYEESIHTFDLVIGQEIGKNFSLSFTIEDILNYPRRFTQGADRAVTYLAWPGTTFVLGLSYKI